MPRTGQPTKLTPALHTAIVTAVAAGVPFSQACLLSGVSEQTGMEWRRRGEDRDTHGRAPKPIYTNFASAIARARAQDEARRIARLNQAAQGGAVVYEKTTTYPDGRVLKEVRHSEPAYQADMFHLERSYAERWSRKLQADLTLNIKALAARVAEEMGVDVELLLAEAQALLKEGSHAGPA